MPIYNSLEYSKNYRKTIGSLCNYYRDELNNDAANNNFASNNVVNSNTFNYKNKIIDNTYNVDSTVVPGAGGARVANPDYDANNSGKKSIELAITLKYLGNFWRALNIPLISCEVSLELKWNKTCVINSQQIGVNLDGGNTAALTGATLTINDCKLYITVVTLSKDDEIKLLTNLKSGFTREIIWNKYRSQMSTEVINNNLNILIDPTFTNVDRLFVLAYQTADDRQSFSQFYLRKVMDIKIYYKLIAIDLSKQQVLQENEDLIQQINFIGRLTEAANVFIIIEKRNIPF